MGFWGVEVKPDKPVPYHADNVRGKLHVTHATLGIGSSKKKSILQCSSGHKSPVFLCSLLPKKIESCPLNLEFGDDDLVAFSVVGERSIHLSGYFVADDGDDLRDDYEYDSFGEDIDETESEDSSDSDSEDDEYSDDFIDDSDMDMYSSSPVPNSGVRIEEIKDDDEPENGDDPQQFKKEEHGKNSQLTTIVRHQSESDVESEDEDGFPISAAEKGKSVSRRAEPEQEVDQARNTSEENDKNKVVDHLARLKRKVESTDEDEQQQDEKKKKKNKLKEHGKPEASQASGKDSEAKVTRPDEKHPEEVKASPGLNKICHAMDGDDGKPSNNDVLAGKKKKKKKKNKTKESEGEAAATAVKDQKLSVAKKSGEEEAEVKLSNVRTFPNGLVIEDLSMKKPDGKKAAPGKKVSVKYIGKLQKNGKIFDSCIGKAPFKFRLGVGQVIKGWEVGINGMRVGDKRRLTIPPSMGYGDKRVGDIPQNSWLVFDVELVGVQG